MINKHLVFQTYQKIEEYKEILNDNLSVHASVKRLCQRTEKSYRTTTAMRRRMRISINIEFGGNANEN